MADTFTQELVAQGEKMGLIKGEKIGLSKGEKRGIEKEKKNSIVRMLKHGLSDEDISIYADVPLSIVKEIKSRTNSVNKFLVKRFNIELKKRDCSGVYALTLRLMAYNSNKIAGNKLTEDEIAFLFDTGNLPPSNHDYKVKDIEEVHGHFLAFDLMMRTLDQELSEDLIKQFHYELKIGVFEERVNGYVIGDYEIRSDIDIASQMKELLEWYHTQEKSLHTLTEFHIRYEIIHPFQSGNGRVGRLILFRECLKNEIMPFIIEAKNNNDYIKSLELAQKGDLEPLENLFREEQKAYKKEVEYFIKKSLST